MALEMPKSDTERARNIEPNTDWPDLVEIVAHKGKKKDRVIITKDHYFGNGSYGAPINGQWIIFQIEQLRKSMSKA